MPVKAEFRGSIIVLEMIGLYEPPDIKRVLLAALDEPRSSGVTGLLFDVSPSISIKQRTSSDIAEMGYFLASESHRFGGRIALVGDRDFLFGMMRLGNTILSQQGVTSEVFRNADAAEHWLQLRAPPTSSSDSRDQPAPPG